MKFTPFLLTALMTITSAHTQPNERQKTTKPRAAPRTHPGERGIPPHQARAHAAPRSVGDKAAAHSRQGYPGRHYRDAEVCGCLMAHRLLCLLHDFGLSYKSHLLLLLIILLAL